MQKAFVLGAGLGTRLRPLTWQRPKPLIPVHHRPLADWAFAHLQAAGVREFVVNTHHLPAEWARCFPGNTWEGYPIHFRHDRCCWKQAEVWPMFRTCSATEHA